MKYLLSVLVLLTASSAFAGSFKCHVENHYPAFSFDVTENRATVTTPNDNLYRMKTIEKNERVEKYSVYTYNRPWSYEVELTAHFDENGNVERYDNTMYYYQSGPVRISRNYKLVCY